MDTDFLYELTWRGLVQDIVPGTENKLLEGPIKAYIGFDPTAPSLTVGNLVALMLLLHFQRAGHKPIVLMGGATGMVGDPSGKSSERTLLTEEQVHKNLQAQRHQFQHFLTGEVSFVNNQEWFGNMGFIEFIRDTGKYLTVSYMLAKDSVKSRMETGISFTEFSYQLLQAYDFYRLYIDEGCILQMGGSDQWGNITSGIELIRRKTGQEAFGITCPLLVKADGTKFGKSAEGNIWLDPSLTSPYKFYQFWLNGSDEEAARYLRYFTLLSKEEIEALETAHLAAPHERLLQKKLAEDLTIRVHSLEALTKAKDISQLLFGGGTVELLTELNEEELLSVFQGVQTFEIRKDELEMPISMIDLLAEKTHVFSSKTEAKKMIAQGGVSVNKHKLIGAETSITRANFLKGIYLLVQKGKKNYFIIKAI